MSEILKIGSLVWAKMKGFSPWPGVIAQPKENVKKSGKRSDTHWIFFFGTKNYAWIEEGNLTPYLDAKAKLINSCKSASFKEAVSEIEQYILLLKGNQNFTVEDFLNDIGKPVNQAKDAEKRPTLKRKRESTPKQLSVSVSKASTSNEKPSSTKRGSRRLSSPKPSSTKSTYSKRRRRENIESPSVSPLGNLTSRNYNGILNQSEIEGPGSPILDISQVSIQQKSKQKIAASTKIFGFLGLGLMGTGMVKNLINSGHRINLWNRTLRKADELKEEIDVTHPGLVTVYPTPSDVVYHSDIIFSCVADVDAIKTIVYANCGVLHHSEDSIFDGKGYVEMSTIDTESTRDLGAVITDKGGRYLEAQVQGNRADACDGTLVILTAGDKTLFEDCGSCFDAMANLSYYLGGIGFGVKMNLVIQLVRGILLAGLIESFVLAERAGLVLKDVASILSLTSMNCPYLLENAAIIIGTDFRNPRHPLQYMQKDLKFALELSDECQQSLVMTAAANESYKHARRLGYDKHDASAVYMRARH